MTAFMPKWRPFDSEAIRTLSLTGGGGRLVLFGATPDFMAQPEAASLAIAVGRCWAASGVFVVLADGCFENPMIHTAADLPNDGGLADVLFLGTPLQDVVHPGGRHLFHVVTAGANAAGPLGEIGSQRWTQLTAEIHREAVTFIVFAPLDSDLGRRALTTCTDIIVLARPEDDVQALLPADEDRVREVIGPIRSGRDRRTGPDRRQQLWKEAANTMRHQADLPAGVRFDRRRRHGSDRRDGDERRDLSSRPKQEQPWDDAYTVAPRDLEPAPRPRRRKRRALVPAIQDSGFGRPLSARGRSKRPPAGGVVGTGQMPAALGGGPIQVGSRGASRARDSGWVVTVAMWLIAAAVALFAWMRLS